MQFHGEECFEMFSLFFILAKDAVWIRTLVNAHLVFMVTATESALADSDRSL